MFCFFDDVQYQPKSFDNRNKIKQSNGPTWLTVPVKKSGFLEKSYLDIEIQHEKPWARKHWSSIELNYRKSPFFDLYAAEFLSIYQQPWEKLVDLNHEMLLVFLKFLDINVPVIRMSEHEFKGSKSSLVQSMCVSLEANIYIFGAQGRQYADVDSFLKDGIIPYFQSYQHPNYSQLYGDFYPFMSVLDLLFNCGPESKNILMSGNISRSELEDWINNQ